MNPNQDKQKEIHTGTKYNENAEHKRKREELQQGQTEEAAYLQRQNKYS